MHMHRSWSPNGYDRAVSLFERGYYDSSHFFRVVPHFLVQFGISYTNDMELKRFADTTINDDPKRQELMPFREGYMSFAGSGPNSRSSQLFIAYDRAGGLGQSPWETPFGEIVNGMDNVKNLYSEYGDMPPWGKVSLFCAFDIRYKSLNVVAAVLCSVSCDFLDCHGRGHNKALSEIKDPSISKRTFLYWTSSIHVQ